MGIAGVIIGWTLSILVVLLSFMLLGMGGYLQFVIMLGISLAFFPPLSGILRSFNIHLLWWMRGIAIIVLYGILMLSVILNPAKTIYKSPKYRESLIKIYDEKLAQWPTPCESRYIDTKYGNVHVIVSGPEDGYPVMLINASSIAAWSWMFNVGDLNKRYRTYAIDNIGEAGKNDLKKPYYIPKTGPEIAEYYTDISSKLGFDRSHVIGASVGGYISTQYAIHAPDRVDKLVLLGSMGYGATYITIATMMLAQGYPLKPIQDATFSWAFGEATQVRNAFGPWFRLVMKGMIPTPIHPKSLTPQALKHVVASTLVYVGTRDAVVGNADKAAKLARNIPHSTVRLVDSGHLIGAELAGLVNTEIMAFLDENSDAATIQSNDTNPNKGGMQ